MPHVARRRRALTNKRRAKGAELSNLRLSTGPASGAVKGIEKSKYPVLGDYEYQFSSREAMAK